MRKRFLTVERLEAVARAALAGGYGRMETFADGAARRLLVLDVKHNCDDPYPYELHARYSSRHGRKVRPLIIRGTARCRKCEPCMKMRAWLWQQKAMAEYAIWPRTLFGTITMSPEQHYMIDAQISAGVRDVDGRYIRHPKRLSELSSEERFTSRVQYFGDELQRYLKRLRKGDAWHKAQCRYLLVAEAHDGARTSDEMRGRPHFHLLIHEKRPGSLVLGSPTEAMASGEDGEYIRKQYKTGGKWRPGVFVKDDAFLRRQWTMGFTKFQFAETAQAASYLCKYLSKTLDARVRASQGYGNGGRPVDQNTECR